MKGKGICPNCEKTSERIGVPCEEGVCQKKGYHYIPFSQYEAFRAKIISMGLSEDTMIGRMIDKYLIVNLIGRGGMGAVYLAYQMPIYQEVALKVISGVESGDANIKRFEREARTISMIDHPNVVKLYDFGFDKVHLKMPYMVLEYVKNAVTLRQYIEDLQKKGIKPKIDEVREIFNQILSALYSAHQSSLVHRDIKPENIMLKRLEDGGIFVKLLDFGLAKAVEGLQGKDNLTRTGMVMGTVQYMAPEQFHFGGTKYADHRVDLYAVGVMIYEVFLGDEPFAGRTWKEIAANKLSPKYNPFEIVSYKKIPQPLEDFLKKALHREPEKRFQSGLEMMEAFNSVCKALLDPRIRETVLNVDFVYLEDIHKKSLQERKTVLSEDASEDREKRIVTSLTPDTAEEDDFSRVVLNETAKKNPLVFILPVVAVLIVGALIFFLVSGKKSNTSKVSQKTVSQKTSPSLITEKQNGARKDVVKKEPKKDVAQSAGSVVETKEKPKEETDQQKKAKELLASNQKLSHKSNEKKAKNNTILKTVKKVTPEEFKISATPNDALIYLNGKLLGKGAAKVNFEVCKEKGCVIGVRKEGYKKFEKKVQNFPEKGKLTVVLKKEEKKQEKPTKKEKVSSKTAKSQQKETVKKEKKENKEDTKKVVNRLIDEAGALYKKGEFESAISKLNKAKQLNKDSDLSAKIDKLISGINKKVAAWKQFVKLGFEAYNKKDYKKTVFYLAKAVKTLPQHKKNPKLIKLVNSLKEKIK